MKYRDFFSEDVLNEDPEYILGEFPRWEFDSYLFVGTKDLLGLIYTNINHSEYITHGELLRTFIKKIKSDIDIKTVGDITSGDFSHKLAGVLMPKQNGVEKTVVSLWSEDGVKLKPILQKLIDEVGAQPPYIFEISDAYENADIRNSKSKIEKF